MKLLFNIKNFSKSVKKELLVYKQVIRNPETPLAPKLLLWIAISYLFLPFDIIPDFIPIIGQIDDIIIIPLLVYFALKLIPEKIIVESRIKVGENLQKKQA